MDPLKDINVGLVAGSLVNKEYWPYYLAILAVILVVALLALYFLVRRRRRAKAPALDAGKKPPVLSPSCLVKAWGKFLMKIPGHFRRSIQIYQPFVVLGESGGGKSCLIDGYTDWQGQAFQFYPSYTNDPVLQIYLGSKVLVLEIPAALLNDTSKQARAALIRLWKKLIKKKDPLVVIVLNGWSLPSEIPENLKRCAQMIRGKINTLAQVCKKPLKVGIALTHMDQVEGFAEFSRFLHGNGIPLKLEFPPAAGLQDMERCLEPYEDYLPLALTTLPADEYLRIVSFFRQIPKVLLQVSSFTRILQSRDPMSPEPEVLRLSLTSYGDGAVAVSNPFPATISLREVRALHPLRKHQLIAASLLMFGVVYLYGGYLYERKLLLDIHKTMDRIEAAPPAVYGEEMHNLFPDFSFSLEQDPILSFLPYYFSDVDHKIRRRLIEGIRTSFLMPKLRQILHQDDSLEKSIYLASLMFATNQNDLGSLILGHVDDWVDVLDFPSILITDYIANNNAEDVKIGFDSFHVVNPSGVSPAEDPLPWLVFLRKVSQACREPLISKIYLESLRHDAVTFLKTIDKVMRYRRIIDIVVALKRCVKGCTDIEWVQKRQSQIGQESLRELLNLIKDKEIAYPPVEGLSLSQLMESMRVMSRLAGHVEDKTFQFSLTGEDFSFSSAKWRDLIYRSRLTLFVRDFVALNRAGDGLPFFQKQSEYPDIVMNPSNDGLLFFTGKARIEGKLTRPAFEQQVKPVLTELPELLKGLPIAEEEKTDFSNFILRQAEAYAGRYSAAYSGYFNGFHMQAENQGALRFLLTQIQSPTSQFQDFLVTMRDNTGFDVGDSPYLKPLRQKLAAFDFIRRLMTEKDGTCPELDRYRAILQQISYDMESNEGGAARNKADDASGLKALLPPLGRISLGILRGESDSCLNTVKAWLKSVGIPPERQAPFLEPAQLAFFLGRSDLETTVNKVWNELYTSYLQPALSKFPLDRSAEADISPSALEALIHPQNGRFWKSFREYLAPVCQETSGTWVVRVAPLGMVRLPDGMLSVTNEVSRLSSALWDDKGLPKPLVIFVKPSSLPPRSEKGPTPILSYLRCDKSSILGFNQQPAWQKVEVEWWKAQTAAVGLELQTTGTQSVTSKLYKEIFIPESDWSFFRLLHKAQVVDKNMLVWRMENPAASYSDVRLEYSVKSDPWALFQFDR